ncbi:M23 family metallopeptidase [Cellvibrio japonicus]|uniref:Peptidase n=1 Tax=Cellvibrio japonicus (strain Ueda107) TaxID=498211 RepID=B3PCL1_CELJU|nr:M23 family metallopeptidase [Cellvibrio japonicus]ACE83749.1 peptidase [Cellvibrio japonicus Ueda107]QEI13240.1 M23 family metallopeptidase [Cellvibrio japonicus]QEI16814.1 M23 family metallopeptidase [Cellvibrio japonicus]QEI20392.1 M23 family metallopeptidase [Cellvibrio japonicus]
MKIIIVNKDHAQARSITLGAWTRAFLSVCLLGIPAALGAWGYSWLMSEENAGLFGGDEQSWMRMLSDRDSKIEQDRLASEAQIAALTSKIAELQARLIRLDALGEKLTAAAKLDQGEFDFSSIPALGGPSQSSPDAVYSAPGFLEAIDKLSRQIDSREQQLNIIDSLLSNRDLLQEAIVAGSPVAKTRMTSGFGFRRDPFTGKRAFHAGIDFAVREGTEVTSVAAGVVNWAGRHPEYGNLVEIKHGSGLVTRYAHNKSNQVKVGDVVKKGQVIALSGSTGRSTAPHVHFEVYKNGRVVDPASYIRRTNF